MVLTLPLPMEWGHHFSGGQDTVYDASTGTGSAG